MLKAVGLALVALMVSVTGAFACDTYKSAADPARVLTYKKDAWTVDVSEAGKTVHYVISSGGTGSGVILAVPENGSDAVQVKTPDGEFWLGPEKFTESCK